MKWFSLIEKGDLHPSGEKKVIKAEEFSTLVTASEVLENAREDANALLEKTKAECETLKEEAKAKGFDEGLEQFAAHMLKMDDELKSLRHKLQQMVLPIALKSAKKVVAKELEIFPETIVEIVLQALTPISESHQVTIYVNKDDKELLESQKPKLKERLDQVELLSIQEKADVAPGGCVIKTESGMINASIENQWRALERAFEKHRAT